MNITTEQLLAKIGWMTIEIEVLRAQLAALQAEVEKSKEPAAE